MKKTLLLISVCFLLGIFVPETNAQYVRSDFNKYFYIGASGGPNLFIGDVKQYRLYPVTNNKNEWSFGFAGTLGYQISPVFGLRGQALYGKLSGTKRDDNLHFNAEVLEGNLCMTFNFNEMFNNNPDRFLNVHGFAGLGVANYKTRLENLNNGSIIHERGYEDGGGFVGTKYIGTLPAGLIFDFKLARTLKLNMEFSLHAVNTDYLDNKKHNFAYDMYSYNAIGLTFQFKDKKTKAAPVQQQRQPQFTKKEEPKQETKQQSEETKDYQELIQPKKVEQQTRQEQTQQQQTKEEPEKVLEEVVEEVVEEDIVNYRESAPAFYYSIQIIAKQKGELNIPMFRNKYSFQREITHHYHEGYNIYTTGQFNSYNEARAVRDQIRGQNGISDAFVVAFKNGVRLNKLP